MKLASEMKNLSEDILASFKQRIKENEELTKENEEFVNEVQKTLDSFRKNHREMAAVLHANARALRKGLADGEKERLNTYNQLMTEIHRTIDSIQKDVVSIQTFTFDLMNEFSANREQMAAELNKFFAQNKEDRKGFEKNRMEEFDTLMKNINNDIKNINDEVLSIFNNTSNLLKQFENEHQEMSDNLRAELGKNLSDRVEYTKALLNGFQKKLAEISKENQQMAQNLRKDLANGETERLNGYKEIMNGIHVTIKEIRKEINDAQKAMAAVLGEFSLDRSLASAEWKKMQDAIAHIKKNGLDTPSGNGEKKTEQKAEKKAEQKVEKKEVKSEIPAEKIKETPVKPEPAVQMSLEEKIVDFINKHPMGVRISEMEKPLGESRMKLGFITKKVLEDGKILKVDNAYFPAK